MRTTEAFSQDKYYESADLDDGANGCIREAEHAYSKDGGLAVLKGNIAEDGCIVKTAGVDESIWVFEGPARIFESQESACNGHPQRRNRRGRRRGDPLRGPRADPACRRCSTRRRESHGSPLEKRERQGLDGAAAPTRVMATSAAKGAVRDIGIALSLHAAERSRAGLRFSTSGSRLPTLDFRVPTSGVPICRLSTSVVPTSGSRLQGSRDGDLARSPWIAGATENCVRDPRPASAAKAVVDVLESHDFDGIVVHLLPLSPRETPGTDGFRDRDHRRGLPDLDVALVTR